MDLRVTRAGSTISNIAALDELATSTIVPSALVRARLVPRGPSIVVGEVASDGSTIEARYPCRYPTGASYLLAECFSNRHSGSMATRRKQPSPVSTTRIAGTSGKPPAAIYNRVSTVGRQDSSLAMDDLRRAAIQRGYDVVLECHETGSGKRNDRPGLAQVLDAARRGEVAAVFVMRLDRFGRSTIDLLANIKSLTSAGVRFACIEQAIDVQPGGDPMANLLLAVLAGVAEFEHAIIRDRVVEGQRRAMARGVVFGRPRDVGPDVEEIRSLRAANKSWSEIADACGCTVALARRRVAEVG